MLLEVKCIKSCETLKRQKLKQLNRTLKDEISKKAPENFNFDIFCLDMQSVKQLNMLAKQNMQKVMKVQTGNVPKTLHKRYKMFLKCYLKV